MSNQFNKIEEIIEDIQAGKMVIMTDDETRENEGDLIFAASHVTPEKVNFMMKLGRGLICTPMAGESLEKLDLADMTSRNQESMKTAFTVSVDAKRGITTGISAHDRARTIELLADEKSQPGDFVKPGHIFPLRARKGGVLVRAGHTEAAVDLARLAGQAPVGVICEIVNDDGSMARLPQLVEFAKEHDLKIGTIQSLIEYRRRFEKIVERVKSVKIDTLFGEWTLHLYQSTLDEREHVALVKGDLASGPTLVRMQSESFMGDLVGAINTRGQEHLMAAMNKIEQEGSGVIVYIRKPTHSLAREIDAYAMNDKEENNEKPSEDIPFNTNLREYGTGAQILKDLGLSELRLITNHPRKIVAIEGYDLRVVERVALIHEEQEVGEMDSEKRKKLNQILGI